MENKLDQLIAKPSNIGDGGALAAGNRTESPWIAAGRRGTNRQRTQSTSLPTKVVENLAKLAKSSTSTAEEEKARCDRTRIVIKPKDNDIFILKYINYNNNTYKRD